MALRLKYRRSTSLATLQCWRLTWSNFTPTLLGYDFRQQGKGIAQPSFSLAASSVPHTSLSFSRYQMLRSERSSPLRKAITCSPYYPFPSHTGNSLCDWHTYSHLPPAYSFLSGKHIGHQAPDSSLSYSYKWVLG